MRDEALAALAPRPDGIYVDATYGRGGHADALLARLTDDARLWLVDRDPQAIALARERHGDDPRCRIVQANFANLGEHLRAAGLAGRIAGILLDLGVSSPQLDQAERGFSFLREGPLDMRMDNGGGETAAQWLERVDAATLIRVLKEYGEERYARRIAAAIGRARDDSALPQTTTGLAGLIAAAVPRPEPGRHPATRSFQAIRIQLNDELDSLSTLLDDVIDLLAPQGRLVVISFHSLEDRRVKRFMTRNSQVGELPPGAGVVPPEKRPSLRRVGRAHRPSDEEVRVNTRARSATMRVAERLP
ncbi:hypothetical protein SPICUR_07675 [Spiribacter curvatus]|uniref:Ribosomal RNA small subunit methyltransferase H n=2 Tax=Spiribacter curvatus TaxID=1335757 RepID=U5T4V9_9GAMM|nr:hypothetical protein SPICUR_07675 [Spiribacter curvatus]